MTFVPFCRSLLASCLYAGMALPLISGLSADASAKNRSEKPASSTSVTTSADTSDSAADRWASKMIEKRGALQREWEGQDMPHQSPWYVTTPLPSANFREVHFPEKGVDLNATETPEDQVRKSADGKSGKGDVASKDNKKAPPKKPAKAKKLWKVRPDWPDGKVNSIPAGDKTSTYLFRTLDCSQPMKLTAGLGSDDGIEVWLNGEKIHSQDVARGVDVDQDRIELDLHQGTNQLLVKIYNIGGSCGFYYSPRLSHLRAVQEWGKECPTEFALVQKYFPEWSSWLTASNQTELERKVISRLLQQLRGPQSEQAELDGLVKRNASADDPVWLALFLRTAKKVDEETQIPPILRELDFEACRLAIRQLQSEFPDKYPHGQDFLSRLEALEKRFSEVRKAFEQKNRKLTEDYVREFRDLQRQALVVENPVCDFEKLLLVKRNPQHLGLPQNWQGNTSINPNIESEIAELNLRSPSELKSIYLPEKKHFVGDLHLHFDAQKLLFSTIGKNNRWQIFEMNVDGNDVKQVTPATYDDIDNYNGIYLPNGNILFDSTSSFVGVPCVGGADYVANLHLLSADRKTVRRLCFEQDNNWYPTMLPDGRVMYARWEYTDSAHYFSRLLMSMNPDGTNQVEYYGSNSYWPNSLFYAKPLPGNTRKFVGIVSGHHGVPRMGELVLFDTGKGRKENSGAVQRLPGRGKPVENKIIDHLVDGSWPKFLHPVPLNDKFILAACKPNPSANWGIYLVDVYDNLVLIKDDPKFALLEPIPLRKTPTPPVIPDKVALQKKTATVLIQDIYTGPGLTGVPRGTVKSLRLFQYEYSYRNMGGHYAIGVEGPWDVRRILGTVPVHEDGSAYFEIPANAPLSLQPLDAEGKALQVKRSWFVGMPGESVSCNGCHNPQNEATRTKPSLAMKSAPVSPTPWRGPKRGFSFVREVQPILDKYCVGCHNGQEDRPKLDDISIVKTTLGGSFPKSYLELHPFIRRNGPEGDYSLLTPLEFHADTSELVQILKKGHYNVRLDDEAWDRLITWIDLNVPAHGTWHEANPIPANFAQRRLAMQKEYFNNDEDIEEIFNPYQRTEKYVEPAPMPAKPAPVAVENWPFDQEKAEKMQKALGQVECRVNLGPGQSMVFRRIPAGQFEMGDLNGYPDEYPTAKVVIAKPFWMATTEVSLAQYRQFDANHRNGYYDMHYKDQVKPGYLMDEPDLPVIRVSWNEAMNFCKWLSKKTGKNVTLPTEAQWEWACRAGNAGSFSYGNLDTDFAPFANLGDISLKQFAVIGVNPQPIPNPDRFWDFVPKEERFNDGVLHLAEVNRYQGNIWGLKNMHGNVAEWTRSTYRPYPYNATVETNDANDIGKKAVRGGSWYERPKNARAGFRQEFPAWQEVYNVGIRLIIEE